MEANGRNSYTDRRAVGEIVRAQFNADISLRGPSISKLHRDSYKALCADMLTSVGRKLKSYYPDQEGYYTGVDFICELTDGIVALHGNLLACEVKHAIYTGMLSYKYHSAPRLNHLFEMVTAYVSSSRVQWCEDAHHTRKAGLNEMDPKVTEVLKKAISEGAKEREDLEKRQRSEKLENIRVEGERQRKMLAEDEARRKK